MRRLRQLRGHDHDHRAHRDDHLGAHPNLTIGTTDFAGELVLANLQADVLGAKGLKVVLRPGLGSRRAAFPALRSGQLDLVPEHAGAPGVLEKEATAPLRPTRATRWPPCAPGWPPSSWWPRPRPLPRPRTATPWL